MGLPRFCDDNQIRIEYAGIMEEDLYDEFGNYIGPEVKDSEEESVSVGVFAAPVVLPCRRMRRRRIGTWTRRIRVGRSGARCLT